MPGQVKPGAKPAPPKFGPPGMPALPQPPKIDLGIPGLPPIDPTDIAKIAAQINVASTIVSALWLIFVAVMFYLMAIKTGTSLPWLAFIPIANIVLMVKIARKPMWWLVLLLVLPIVASLFALLAFVDPTGGIIVGVLVAAMVLVCIVAWLLVSIGIARARGKSVVWGILLFIPCFNVIALAYLGLSK